MGFGTTFAMLSFLMIFAGMTMFVINVQTSITGAMTAIKDQSQNNLQAQNQEITITNVNYALNAETPWSITYADEFAQGTFNQTTTNTDAVQLAGTNISGTYESPIYNTGHQSNYTTIAWNSIGTVEFQIRTANTTANLQSANYIGPDTTTATRYNTPAVTINSIHNNNQYIQYKVYLSGTTPSLQDTTIGVRRNIGHAQLIIENTGSEKLQAQQTTTYIDGIRQTRDETTREYILENLLDARLWNPGEELNLTVFTNNPATITINNDRAQQTINI